MARTRGRRGLRPPAPCLRRDSSSPLARPHDAAPGSPPVVRYPAQPSLGPVRRRGGRRSGGRGEEAWRWEARKS